MADKVELLINGKSYHGWTDVSITRAIDKASSEVALTATQRQGVFRDIWPGMEFQVKYGKDVLCTGYLDIINVSYDASSHTVTLQGRSKTKDLVDCSALKTSTFTNQRIIDIANALASDYNIKVVQEGITDDKPVASFQVEPNGETVFAAIQRLAEQQGMVLTDTPDGRLLLTKAKTSGAAVRIVKEKGKPTRILSASAKFDESQLYSEVRSKGQAIGDDNNFGKSISQIMGTAKSSDVGRKRVLIVKNETDTSTGGAEDHAAFELAAKVGNSLELTYTMAGWRDENGALWRENTPVSVNDDLTGFQFDDLLIGQVTYKISNDAGTTCELQIKPPVCYLKPPKGKDITAKKHTKLHKTTSKGKASDSPDDFYDVEDEQ